MTVDTDDEHWWSDDVLPNRDNEERPWNNAQANADAPEDEDLHQNAQSSLDVTMHNIDVQRKKRRRKPSRPTEDDDSGSDSDRPPAQRQRTTKKKSSRKKRANRRQKSRSIKDVDEDRRPLVEACYALVQMEVTTKNPWPSTDPVTGDDQVETIVAGVWARAIVKLDLDAGDVAHPSEAEFDLITSRISQVRGCVMTAADTLVPSAYGFVDPSSLSDPTPETIAATLEANRQLVEDLTGCFMYLDPKQTSDLSTICCHPIFQKLLNVVFFAKRGSNRRAEYFMGIPYSVYSPTLFTEKGSINIMPLESMALLMVAVVCAIDRWKTGEYNCKANPFDAKVYAPIHEATIQFLESWVVEYQAEVYPVDLATERRREMLTKARMLCDSAVEQLPTRPSMFPLHVFQNVRAAVA
ncbi:hypothetical protein GGX14DRAFT_569094 [Mycena pura]|uniref:DUF6532 domain-containing protein n=1 Tax=Mycena pura TaxID=153505 RepID=A0AAD6V9T0_9AGAR|nr:hypothetical protein GGX14DRAFT_569094 [Mycena pura]